MKSTPVSRYEHTRQYIEPHVLDSFLKWSGYILKKSIKTPYLLLTQVYLFKQDRLLRISKVRLMQYIAAEVEKSCSSDLKTHPHQFTGLQCTR
jgi:hypothetical protein